MKNSNLIFVVALLFLVSCTSISSKRTIYYAIKPGDTLYSIAWRYQTTYQSLAKLNKIKSPYVIHADDVIKVRYQKDIKIADDNSTKTKAKTKANTLTRTKASTNKNTSTTSKATARAATTKISTTKTRTTGSVKHWQWPLNGPIPKAYGSNKGILKGILISSDKNSDITASNAGEVVYAGSGLRSYGKLIIIKHNADYLSAYGYLNNLRVKEGDSVKKGQSIAKLGVNQEGKSLLHFEIRHKGRPVDPINYLPTRN